MRKTYFLTAFLAASLAVGCAKVSPVAEPDGGKEENVVTLGQASPYYSGVVTVKLTEGLAEQIGAQIESGALQTKSSQLNGLIERYGIKSFTRVFPDNERFAGRLHREGLDRWYRVEFDTAAPSVTKAADDFLGIDGIEVAEPMPKVRMDSFNDPYLPDQWALGQSSGVDINVSDVWSSYTTGDPRVIVAVMDQGVALSHEDLQWNTLPMGAGGSRNFANDGAAVSAGAHGTHVAGVIAAVSNNGKGISGIAGGDYAAGSRGVTIMSCQLFGSDGSFRGFEAALQYAADNGAVISQNSWGFTVDLDNNGIISDDELNFIKNLKTPESYKTAIEYFIKYAGCDNDGNQLPDSPMKGGVVFFAAGNDDIQYGVPADYESVIAVGSIASNGTRSSFSNYGDWVDICAPGSSIWSAVPDGYTRMSGTSMACPMVSGVAALVLSSRGGVGFTNEHLKACLLNGASNKLALPASKPVGPFVDALGAVTYGLGSAPENIKDYSLSAKSNSITVEWTVPAKQASSTDAAYGTMVALSRDKSLLENLDPSYPPSGVTVRTVKTSDLNPGDIASCTISRLAFSTEYYATVVAYNYGPVYSAATPVKRIETKGNNPPVITTDSSLKGIELKASGSMTIAFMLSDPDEHDFTYTYTEGSSAETWTRVSGAACSLRIDGAKGESGSYEARLVAKDSYGAETLLKIPYTILPNTPPVVEERLQSVLLYLGGKTREIELDGAFSDSDGDSLSYSVVSSSAGCVHAVASGSTLYLTPRKQGSVTLAVSAFDPRGAQASQEVKVVVREKEEDIDVYPTQVKSMLHVGTLEDKTATHIEVFSTGGATVYDETLDSSAFEPATVDLSRLAPGQYSVRISFDGKTVVRNIVKV